MGSAEEETPPPPKAPPKSTSAAEAHPPVLPVTPPYSAEWATAVQAYYSAAAGAAAAGATPPPFYAPAVWGSQMMSPYGTPIPYSPMYHPVYAHPSAATAAGYPVGESASGKSKGGGGGSGKSGDGGKVTSGSADEYGSQSGGESGSEGSSDTRDNGNESQDAARKRSFGKAFTEGETSQAIIAAQNNGTTADSPYTGRPRTVSKLPVSAPGRATLPGLATNLNIGIDPWSASHVGAVPKDERELKRERRKQSNRESARRSRLRKQQECEDLARKVTELNSENTALKVELEQLNKACKDLEAENTSITEDLNRMAKTGMLSQHEAGAHNPQNPIGSDGNSYNPAGNFESVTR